MIHNFHVLWTDEAIFTRQGILNQIVIWLHENPRAIHEYFQHGSQCNIWLGIMVNILIEFIFYYRLNKNGFLTFLNNKFYDLSKNISLKMIMNFWFQLEMAVLFIIVEILDISLIFIFPEDRSIVLDLRLSFRVTGFNTIGFFVL